MTIFFKIKRQKNQDSQPYEQTFAYDGPLTVSIIGALHSLNYRPELTDIDGKPADRIEYESSCIQKRCGACAILVNGKPHLGCEVFLEDITVDTDTIEVAPLSKFPMVRDLVVDRGSVYDNMEKMNLWLTEKAQPFANEEEGRLQYKSAHCLQCGICLEACPEFKGDGIFYSTPGLVAAYKLIEQSQDGNHRQDLISKYQQHFLATCDESYDCQDACPADIPIKEMLVRLNGVVQK